MAESSRVDQIRLIGEPSNRDEWLAAELDGVEGRFDVAMAKLDKKFGAAMVILLGVFVSTTTSAIMLAMSSGT